MDCHDFHIVYLNSIRGLNEARLASVWKMLESEGLAARLFYDGAINNADAFIDELIRPGVLTFLVYGKCCEPAALSWLNCITGRMARTHFVIFRKYWGRKLRNAIGRHFYRYLLTRKDTLGYLFDCLYGITPKCNPLAWKAAIDCGWRKVGELPNACFMAGEKRSVPGIITCATRELLAIDEYEKLEAAWKYTPGC